MKKNITTILNCLKSDDMRLGIIGLGSIGKRHVRSLSEIGERDIIALRTSKGTTKKLPPDLSYVQECWDSKEFYALSPEGVVIANPTVFHIDAMKEALRREIPVFVEKPLANSFKQVDEIQTDKRHLVMLGLCLRYHPVIRTVMDIIGTGRFGKLYTANLYCGQYLPTWHPYADYRSEYYSRKELGGGVLRTLSHELDLAFLFCGEIDEICSAIGRISDLEIDVEDYATLLCRLSRGSVVTIGLDFLNPRTSRCGMLIGEHGSINYTFDPPSVIFHNRTGEEEHFLGANYGDNGTSMTNMMYKNQMEDFCAFIREKRRPAADFTDGMRMMAMITAAEESMLNHSWVAIKKDFP